MPANPAAIAWYLERSERLLDDLRDRVQALRVRGGQIAGFSGAVLALAGANVEPLLDVLHGIARDCAGAALLLGVFLLVAALVTALRGSLLPRLVSQVSAEEVLLYASERFTHEADLWRVQVRMIRGMFPLIETTTIQGDEAAQAIRNAECLFLAGLSSVGIAFGILISVVAF